MSGNHVVYGVSYYAKGVRGTDNLHKLLVLDDGGPNAATIEFVPKPGEKGVQNGGWRTGKAIEIKLLVLFGANGNVVTLDFKVPAGYVVGDQPECLVEFWAPDTTSTAPSCRYFKAAGQEAIAKCEPPFQQLLTRLVTSAPWALGDPFDPDNPLARVLPPAPILSLEQAKRLTELILSDMKYRVDRSKGDLPTHPLIGSGGPCTAKDVLDEIRNLLCGTPSCANCDGKPISFGGSKFRPFHLEEALLEIGKARVEGELYGRVPPALKVPLGESAESWRVAQLRSAVEEKIAEGLGGLERETFVEELCSVLSMSEEQRKLVKLSLQATNPVETLVAILSEMKLLPPTQ